MRKGERRASPGGESKAEREHVARSEFDVLQAFTTTGLASRVLEQLVNEIDSEDESAGTEALGGRNG